MVNQANITRFYIISFFSAYTKYICIRIKQTILFFSYFAYIFIHPVKDGMDGFFPYGTPVPVKVIP